MVAFVKRRLIFLAVDQCSSFPTSCACMPCGTRSIPHASQGLCKRAGHRVRKVVLLVVAPRGLDSTWCLSPAARHPPPQRRICGLRRTLDQTARSAKVVRRWARNAAAASCIFASVCAAVSSPNVLITSPVAGLIIAIAALFALLLGIAACTELLQQLP